MSDIHFGQERDGSIRVHEDVRSEVLNDCIRFSASKDVANGIIICGDTAYSGQREEYKNASDWLENLAKACSCSKTDILVVPGNHDVDLEGVIYPCECAHREFRSSPEERIDELLEKYDSTRFSPSPLLHKLDAYRKFAAQYGCDFESTCSASWQKKFSISTAHKIVFVGMNTVLSSDKSDAPGKMILGSKQYVIPRHNNVEYIVLMHHPLEWLKDKHFAESYLFSRARLILTGHEHRLQILRACIAGGSQYIHICSGAANPNERSEPYNYRYNWIEIELKENSNKYQLIIKIFPRKWNYSTTKFIPDTELTMGEEFYQTEIECPNFFRNEEVPCSPAPPVNIEDVGCDILMSGSTQMTETNAPEFARLRYFFWKYLDRSARMEIFVKFQIFPASNPQPLSQTIEGIALGELAKRNLLHDAWDAIMTFVPEGKREANPFTKGEIHA